MTMDDLIFEMEQPNEILSGSEWTEWWAIDETGLHLEYAPGYEPENQQTESCVDESTSIYIDVNCEYDKKMNYLQDRYEEVFGKLDENFANNMYTENDIDLFADKPMQPFPITQSSVDYDTWPSDYLEHLRDIIDEYNGDDSEWKQELSKLRAEVPKVDTEEQVVDVPSTDGLILPN
jgi:hypothetical protein